MTKSNTLASGERPAGRERIAKITKKTALVAGASSAAAALVLGATAAASAVVTGTYSTRGVNIRTAPSTSAPSIGQGEPGQVAYVYCFTTGTSVHGDPYWLYNADHTTHLRGGYSAWEYITFTGMGAITHC